MASDTMTGNFVWFDLMTKDPEGAKAFYTSLLGWTTQPFGGDDSGYTMWNNGEIGVGGFMQLPPEAEAAGAPSHWIAYIATPDTDGSVARAVELGATVQVPPQDIPEAGRFAILRDPQGAHFALYTHGKEYSELSAEPKIGHFSWHELMTTDYAAACDFYCELCGWQKGEAMDMGEAGIYQLYGLGQAPLGGMFNKPAEMPGPPAWLYYVRVADVKAAAEKVQELGGTILNGPLEVPGGDWIVQCMDPQGAAFALHQITS